MTDPPEPDASVDEYAEVVTEQVVWRFEREFLTSNWRCRFGDGCLGILERPAPELAQGCCSLGAHFGDGQPGQDEAMNVSAYASMIPPERFQFRAAAHDATPDPQTGAHLIFGDAERTHTRVVEGACIFLNRPGFPGGEGCALHLAALDAGESPVDWKPSVCWQLPLRIDWQEIDERTETATVRRWSRADWGDHGRTMAWCCTERDEQVDDSRTYDGEAMVVDSLADELRALTGDEVYVQLRRKL